MKNLFKLQIASYRNMYKNENNIYIYRIIGRESRVFADGPDDLGSIPGCVIPETLKMVLDA